MWVMTSAKCHADIDCRNPKINAKKTMVARHWREMLTLSYFVGASARLLKFSNEPFPIDNEILYCDACHMVLQSKKSILKFISEQLDMLLERKV